MPKDPDNPLRETEVARWREREKKDLETEHDHRERPLEGLSHATGTTAPPGIDDDRIRRREHGSDELRSERASREQIPPDEV